MVRLIVGEKGKGKTKVLLDKVNAEVKESQGSVIYLDKSTKNMHELSNKVRLINVSEYNLSSSDEFVAFILGLLSGNYDIQEIFIDSYLKIAAINGCDMAANLDRLSEISKKFNINLTLSVSCNKDSIPDNYQSSIIVSL